MQGDIQQGHPGEQADGDSDGHHPAGGGHSERRAQVVHGTPAQGTERSRRLHPALAEASRLSHSRTGYIFIHY